MTKEELNKESQQYTLSHTTPSLYRVVDQAYLAGAEPREKQIEIDAEQILALQKQNGELTDKVKELEHQLTHRNCLDCSNHSSKLRMRTLELEKENAELKSRECWKSCEYANPKSELIAQHIKDIQQLTKAKEIIKNLLILKNDHYGNTKMEWRVKVTEQAEQFISEVEK